MVEPCVNQAEFRQSRQVLKPGKPGAPGPNYYDNGWRKNGRISQKGHGTQKIVGLDPDKKYGVIKFQIFVTMLCPHPFIETRICKVCLLNVVSSRRIVSQELRGVGPRCLVFDSNQRNLGPLSSKTLLLSCSCYCHCYCHNLLLTTRCFQCQHDIQNLIPIQTINFNLIMDEYSEFWIILKYLSV